MKRSKTQKKQTLLLVAALAFVGLMAVLSVALMQADDDGVVVNLYNVEKENSMTLEDGSTNIDEDLLKPISMLDDQLELEAIEEINFDEADMLNYTGTEEVPEPATMSLLALGGVAMLRRRRRNRK